MENQIKFESPHEEISALKKRLAELEGVSHNERTEAMKESIKQHVEQNKENISEAYKIPHAQAQIHAKKIAVLHSGQDGACERQVSELLQFAQEKGIVNAVSVAQSVGDPHLEDAFHDALVSWFQGNVALK